MIRVSVKASSAVVQAGLEKMIASEPDFHLIREQRSRQSGREMNEDEPPDVIIAELEGAEEESGWPDLLDLNGPDAGLLLLTEDPGSPSGVEALRAGARGVLPARISREELLAAVRAAAAGLTVLHAQTLPAAIPVRPPGATRTTSIVEPLTPREKEVLIMLAEGGSNKEIASRLSISEHTAKFHVSSIMSKLGVTSRTEAVTSAIKQGIIML